MIPRRSGSVAALMLAIATLLALAGFISGSCADAGAAKVILQLNWYNEAEFAGYYMAEEKGFYNNRHLEVTILEGGPGTPAREQVLKETATFAITSFAEQRELIAKRQPTVAVMAGFQIPPLVIFALAESGIREPADLTGRKVGVTTTYWETVLHETLAAAGVDPGQVHTVSVRPDQMDMLYNHGVDAWLGYAQDEPIRALTAGHPVVNIFPADYGVGGYEGLVITLQKTIDTDPDMVRRFIAASYEGWRYAIEHPDEAAKVLAKWAPGNTLEFHKLAMRSVAPLVDTPQCPVGWIDAARWQQLMGDAWNAERPGFTMAFSPVTTVK